MNLCVCVPNFGLYSETFILNHIKALQEDGVTAVVTSNIINDNWVDVDKIVVEHKNPPAKFEKGDEEKIIEFFKIHNITHILIEYGVAFSALMELNLRILKIPVVVHFHGFDASASLKDYQILCYYKWLWKYAQGFVVISKKMKKRLIDIGMPKEKLLSNPHGVKITEIKNKTNSTKCRFIFVGRFVGKKAPDLLLQSFAISYRKNPNIELIMIGDATVFDTGRSLFEKCKKYVQENSLQDAVKFLGALPYEEFLEQLKNADVYIQHSMVCPLTGDSEGTPHSILEAGSLGLPVVSTFHEGIPEVVINNTGGILVEEGDVLGMSEAMLRLSKDAYLREEMGQSIRKHIEKNYDIKFRNKLLKDYLVRKKFDLDEMQIASALQEYKELDIYLQRAKELVALIKLKMNNNSVVAFYGGGYGLELFGEENLRYLKKALDIRYLIDERSINKLDLSSITFEEFRKMNDDVADVIFLISAINVEVFKKIQKNIKSIYCNAKIVQMHKELLK